MLLDRRRTIALVAVLAVLVVVGVVGTVVVEQVLTDDAPATTVTELDAEAAELLDALRAERAATYHAVYEGDAPDLPGGGIRLETWQAPPSRREDTEITVDGEPVVASTIATPDGTVRCRRPAGEEWTCERADGDAADATDGRLAEFEQRIREGDVTVRDATVDGRAVRCFTLTVAGESTERCTTPTGVPVLVRAGGSELRLVELDETVPPERFAPPVDPD